MVKIVADTLSCINPDLAAQKGIGFLPQMIIFDDKTYRDDTEINSISFLEKLRSSRVLPKTAAPSPALYIPIYRQFLNSDSTIIVICPSDKLSGTLRSAQVAAKDFPGADIRFVDTGLVGSGLGAIVLKAIEWVKSGLNPDIIVSQIVEMASRGRVFFLVNTLEYLYKGGRIGGAQALAGSLLQIKPILTLKEGLTQPFENQRTKKRAAARLKEIIVQECPQNQEAQLCIMHGDAEAEAQQIAHDFSRSLKITDIPICHAPPAILVHTGPKAIGVSFFINSNNQLY
jgi:DegV family protein with EDD domain